MEFVVGRSYIVTNRSSDYYGLILRVIRTDEYRVYIEPVNASSPSYHGSQPTFSRFDKGTGFSRTLRLYPESAANYKESADILREYLMNQEVELPFEVAAAMTKSIGLLDIMYLKTLERGVAV
jgi:hypothetical protein